MRDGARHGRRWIRGAAMVLALATVDGPVFAEEAFEKEVPTVPGDQLLPLIETDQKFRIVSGDGSRDEVRQILRRAGEDEPGDWVLSFGNLNVLYFRRGDQGALRIARMDLFHEKRAIVYEPSVRLIPARLRPKLHEVGTGVARVLDLETEEETHVGEFRHEIEQVARSRFNTPSGPVSGFLVVLDHVIDLGAAEVRLSLEGGYVPGAGLVYRRMRYTETTLWVFGETTRRTAEIAEALRPARHSTRGDDGN